LSQRVEAVGSTGRGFVSRLRRNPGGYIQSSSVALKVIMDRSDNGNEFLCQSCRHGRIRSGQQTEMEVWCTNQSFARNLEGSEPVSFPVSQCDEFARVDPSRPTRAQYSAFEKLAYYIVISDEGRGTTLIPPDVARSRGLFDD
jgi:hypothetical protein